MRFWHSNNRVQQLNDFSLLRTRKPIIRSTEIGLYFAAFAIHGTRPYTLLKALFSNLLSISPTQIRRIRHKQKFKGDTIPDLINCNLAENRYNIQTKQNCGHYHHHDVN